MTLQPLDLPLTSPVSKQVGVAPDAFAEPAHLLSAPVSSWAIYGFAVANVGAVTVLKHAVEPWMGAEAPFLIYLWPVIASAYVGGLRSAFAAICLSMLAVNYYFLPPRFGFNFSSTSGVLLVVFFVEAMLIAWIVAAMREARRRAEAVTLALKGSQELFEKFMENTPAVAVIKDENGRMIYANRTAEQRFGWTPGGWRGKTALELWPPEIAAAVLAADRKVLSTGQVLELLGQAEIDGRDEFWLDSRFPVRSASGQQLIAGVSLNVTDREYALAALRESEERLRLAVDGAGLGTWYYEPASRLLVWSDRCKSFFGLPPHQHVTYDIFLQGLHPEDRDRIHQAVQAALQGERSYDVEYKTVGFLDKKVRWIASKGRGFAGPSGSVERLIGISLDITAAKEAEEQLRSLNEELAAARDVALAASRAKSVFLANMSHELRTPLNAIIGYAEMLEEDLSGSAQQCIVPDLQRIRTAGFHLLNIINDVLDLSKIEAGRMELIVSEFDLAEEIEEAVATVLPLAQRNENTLEVSIAPDVGVVRSDQAKIRQALFNLLSNACKFTQNGAVRLEATREFWSRGGIAAGTCCETVVLKVSDTGIGIEASKLELLFEDFSQVDPSPTRRFGGTGLGLSISRRLVTMLGGEISVETNLGCGSAFTVRIPNLTSRDV